MARSRDRAASIEPARLRRWVLAIGIVAIVANIAIDAYNQWRSYRFTIGDASRELTNDARILAAQTNATLEAVDVLLRGVVDAHARGKPAMPPAEYDAVLAARVQGLPQLIALTITDAEGNALYRSRASGDEAYRAVVDRSYFTAQRDNPNLGLFVSEPLVTRSSGRAVIVLSRRLTGAGGSFAGVVDGVIDLEQFQAFYRQIKPGTRSAILLFRDDGTLLVREPPRPDRIGKSYPALASAVPAAGAARAISPIDGVPRFLAGAHADSFPITVAIAREEAAVLDPWRKELYLVAVQDVVLSALIALAIAALVYQLRRVELSERALRESEERYALAMEGANEGHFDRMLHGGPVFVSPKMKELLGLRGDQLVRTRDEALANIHPDDRHRVDAAMKAHLERSTERYELEYRVRHADGQWHWLLVRGRYLRDADGNPYRLVGSAIDISDRKRAEMEKEKLEVELRKSQKMEAMGTLAGGIAHDFNNILGAILGYGELAQKGSGEGGVVRRYVDNVMQAAGRAKALVERILAFSRSGVGERTPINVQAVVAETLDLLAPSLPGRVQLRRRLDAGDAAVIGDATQLHQVAMNLCTNAVQAMPAGGVLEVGLDRVEVPARRSLFHGELAPGPYVRLTARDTGTGIPADVLDRIFDPFFTTKGVGVGTGLGLSLVHGIVADVGGAIDVVTVLDEGTTFTIWLPVAGTAPVPDREADGERPHGNGEVVMVVDDEPALVALAEEMLAELGYEPVGFRSSTAAFEAFRQDPRRFDVVLTDEMMPELTGRGLALEVRRIRPDVPILIMSGYVDAGFATVARSTGIADVLRKPLRSRDIAEALARVLAPSAASAAAH
jgi:PAS domain S-box-containing protein